jgi:hypothetical protein
VVLSIVIIIINIVKDISTESQNKILKSEEQEHLIKSGALLPNNNPSTQEQRHEDYEFEASLSYITTLPQ